MTDPNIEPCESGLHAQHAEPCGDRQAPVDPAGVLLAAADDLHASDPGPLPHVRSGDYAAGWAAATSRAANHLRILAAGWAADPTADLDPKDR